MAQVQQIPWGKTKGTPITEATEQDIRGCMDRMIQTLAEDPEHKFADSNRRWIDGARAELINRGIDPKEVPTAPSAATRTAPAQRPAQSSALTKAPTQSQAIVGQSYDAGAVNKLLEDAMATAHLVSPATVCGALPPGCEVAISLVQVDPNSDRGGPGDVVDVGGGKLALSGHVLKRIAAAAGVSWDMNASGRLDNGSDPHYAHYRAVGLVRNFDGSVRAVSGEVEIDMREGSPQIEAMEKRARSDASKVANQVRDIRLFILRHAETKAKLRAIADMGVKRSYTPAELRKPFKVARLMWTGHSNDPELRRIFAEKTADAMIGATSMLYGGQPAPQVRPTPQMMPSGPPIPQLHAPPPAGSYVDDPYDHDEEPIDVPQAPPTPRSGPAPTQAAASGEKF